MDPFLTKAQLSKISLILAHHFNKALQNMKINYIQFSNLFCCHNWAHTERISPNGTPEWWQRTEFTAACTVLWKRSPVLDCIIMPHIANELLVWSFVRTLSKIFAWKLMIYSLLINKYVTWYIEPSAMYTIAWKIIYCGLQ